MYPYRSYKTGRMVKTIESVIVDSSRVIEKEMKTRKRGCCWSSSSSSLVGQYRLKRAVLFRKRVGLTTTPVPTWKLESRVEDDDDYYYCDAAAAVSARYLGATLWEITNMPTPHKSVAQKKERSNHRRKTSVVTNYNADITEIQFQSQNQTPRFSTRLKDACNGLAAAKELLKVLSRIWAHKEQRSSTIALVSALRFELDRAHSHVDHLKQHYRVKGYEINSLFKFFSEEKAAWKSKDDRIQNAITSMGGELKVENKLRKQSERLNRKLGNELADTKASLSKALNELQTEKRAREMLEQVCDELARGIGDDRDEMEELKRESAKVREEVEKEREMLQIADVLREERVQMKLSEAKYEFEEKNAAVERMKSELEAYLKDQTVKEKSYNSPTFSKINELEEYLWNTLGASLQTGERGEGKREFIYGEEDDSADSDLHSIELNMDNNSRNFKWGYTCDGITPNDSKRNSVDGKIKGRRSISEKTQRNIICLDQRNSDGSERDLGIHGQDGIDKARLLELISCNLKKGYQDEIERFDMVKDLRDHIVAGAKISPSQGLPMVQYV